MYAYVSKLWGETVEMVGAPTEFDLGGIFAFNLQQLVVSPHLPSPMYLDRFSAFHNLGSARFSSFETFLSGFHLNYTYDEDGTIWGTVIGFGIVRNNLPHG